jgi:hypothetical protein
MAKALAREIRESDVATVVRMVHDLAAYEKSSDECRMTVEQLREVLFCATPALFGHVRRDGWAQCRRQRGVVEPGDRREQFVSDVDTAGRRRAHHVLARRRQPGQRGEQQVADRPRHFPAVHQRLGTGSVAERLWARPSVSVLAIDAPSVADASTR